MFAGIAICGHSDHKIDITIKFTSKSHSRTYIILMYLPVLPYMVTLITKWTSPSNSHQKTAPEHIYVCRYCHIWSLGSQNRHHHQIHIKKSLQNIYNTYVVAGIAIYGHSDHKMDITIKSASKKLLQNIYNTHVFA